MYLLLQTMTLFALGSMMSPETNCDDTSGHRLQMVEVEPGVSVELLEWSKQGPPLLLLAGLGNTGHVYDEFAHQFTHRYRVLALTRRGFGRSSQPEDGYSTDQLANDIRAVLDSLGIERITLVGHSIAGEEMTRFAVQFPARTAALIFLDSAFDHTQAVRIMEESPPPSPPPPAPEDSASVLAFSAYWARTNIRFPLAEICTSSRFGPSGAYLGSVTPGSVFAALITGLQAPEFKLVKAPTLAIYSVARPPDQDYPYYYDLDESQRKEADRFVRLAQDWADQQRSLFQAQIPTAAVRNLTAADHYLFISHEGHVTSEILRFLSGLRLDSSD